MWLTYGWSKSKLSQMTAQWWPRRGTGICATTHLFTRLQANVWYWSWITSSILFRESMLCGGWIIARYQSVSLISTHGTVLTVLIYSIKEEHDRRTYVVFCCSGGIPGGTHWSWYCLNIGYALRSWYCMVMSDLNLRWLHNLNPQAAFF